MNMNKAKINVKSCNGKYVDDSKNISGTGTGNDENVGGIDHLDKNKAKANDKNKAKANDKNSNGNPDEHNKANGNIRIKFKAKDKVKVNIKNGTGKNNFDETCNYGSGTCNYGSGKY
jgi:hypothetical protein